ncbi:DgyrCDS9571 [Dimorphilus gyrociliatus]|uniref:ADP-ribosylation factor-like protein 6-interacting protein 4 n=1 Tax=Dimorphilus gyrociliatus TaxID=2664684 RepID=A0A7I8VXD6_9ANNE|nr:DgyrCDS9571 [Dimorphilus gyrociliatus]
MTTPDSPEEDRSRKRRRQTASTSRSTSSDSSFEIEKKKKKHKKEKKKHKHSKKSKHKKKSKKHKKRDEKERDSSPDAPKAASETKETPKNFMRPMTYDEWKKKSQEIRREFDPESGRIRLIRGEGEIIEEIVSKKRQMEINRNSTLADGEFYAKTAGTYKQ